VSENPLKSLTGYSRFVAETYPHHKHVPPDIKHHRIPAPEMSFTHPNLPVLIREVEELLQQQPG